MRFLAASPSPRIQRPHFGGEVHSVARHESQVVDERGGVEVAGWVVDPEVFGPISVTMYVDGVGKLGTVANATNPGTANGPSIPRASRPIPVSETSDPRTTGPNG